MKKEVRFNFRLDHQDSIKFEEIKKAFNNDSLIKLSNSDIFRILIRSAYADLQKEGKLNE